MEPRALTVSKSMGQSKSLASKMGALAPPGMTALIFRPVLEPPARSFMMKSSGRPRGSSYRPGRFTCPDRQ